jgi:hypothetical protein
VEGKRHAPDQIVIAFEQGLEHAARGGNLWAWLIERPTSRGSAMDCSMCSS